MPRRYNGHFATIPQARLDGVGTCPWCRSFTFRPEVAGRHIDPADMAARVCRCGYDSRRGRVGADDFHRAVARLREANAELVALYAPDGPALVGPDSDIAAILDDQVCREAKRVAELFWLVEGC